MAAPAADHPTSRPMPVRERLAFTLVPLAAFVALLVALATRPLPYVWRTEWAPALGVELAFRIDGLSALMLLLITGVGVAVFVYAGGYLQGDPHQRRLYVLLTAFFVAMVGAVSADDLFLLFVFWELTSLTSFLLVGFRHEDLASRKSAQQALVVTAGGGLALFAGFLLLARIAGTSNLTAIVASLPDRAPAAELAVALLLVFAGAFAKSAQVPFHFWLPNAMAAPTPVSAYLHSATMVKLGVYLLGRLDPGFGHWPLWQGTLGIVGSLTAGWAMLLALRERDLKRILAWSTVATLGALVLLIGLATASASVAAATLLLAHALYKAPLFFVAGNVDHGTGTRSIDRLGNLRRAMPYTAAAALLAGLSMAGIPLTFGFLAKDLFRAAKLAGGVHLVAQAAYWLFGVVAVAVAAVAAIRVFWRHPGDAEPPTAHEGGPSLVGPPLVLAGLGIVLGSFPHAAKWIVTAAAGAMRAHGGLPDIDFAPHPAPLLGTLATTLGVGTAVFLGWDSLHRRLDRLARHLDPFASVAHYGRLMAAIPRIAARTTQALQHGRLPGYVSLLLAAAASVLGVLLWLARAELVWPAFAPPSAGVAGACAAVAAGALLAARFRHRLALMLASGVVGFGSAAFFLFAGAPDVAFTQFAVEAVFVIVVASVLLALMRRGRVFSLPEPPRSGWRWLVAAGFATALTVLFLHVSARPIDTSLPEWFAARSVPAAHGRNVVNVILVDFRALDTLGESTVVLLSFLAVVPLLGALASRRRQPGARR